MLTLQLMLTPTRSVTLAHETTTSSIRMSTTSTLRRRSNLSILLSTITLQSLDAFPGIYANAIFYVMNGSQNLGVYRMNGNIASGDRFDEGRLYIDLVNISNYDYQIENNVKYKDKLTLLSIPLAASKYILDFDNKMPMVTWNEEVSDLFEHVMGLNPNTKLTRAVVYENDVLYTGKASRVAASMIQIDHELSQPVTIGSLVWSSEFTGLDGMRPGVGTIASYARANNGKYRLIISGVQIMLSLAV